jgi:hypothetical protein
MAKKRFAFFSLEVLNVICVANDVQNFRIVFNLRLTKIAARRHGKALTAMSVWIQ